MGSPRSGSSVNTRPMPCEGVSECEQVLVAVARADRLGLLGEGQRAGEVALVAGSDAQREAAASRARRSRAVPRAAGWRSAATPWRPPAHRGRRSAGRGRSATRAARRRLSVLQVRRVGPLAQRDAVAHLADPPGALGHLVEIVGPQRRGSVRRREQVERLAPRVARRPPRGPSGTVATLGHRVIVAIDCRGSSLTESVTSEWGVAYSPTPARERPPVILAVDDDPDAIELLGGELEDRYGRAYQILTARAATTALDQLTESARGGRAGGPGPVRPVAARRHRVRAARPGPRALPALPAAAPHLVGRVGGGRDRPARCGAASASGRSTTTCSSPGGQPTSCSTAR